MGQCIWVRRLSPITKLDVPHVEPARDALRAALGGYATVSFSTSLSVKCCKFVSHRLRYVLCCDAGRAGDSKVLHKADMRVKTPLKMLYRSFLIEHSLDGDTSSEDDEHKETDSHPTVDCGPRPPVGVEAANRIRQAVLQCALAAGGFSGHHDVQRPQHAGQVQHGAFAAYRRHGIGVAMGFLEAQCRAVRPRTEQFSAGFLIGVLNEAKAALAVDVAHELAGEAARAQSLHGDSHRALVQLVQLLAVQGTVILPEVLTAVGVLLHSPPELQETSPPAHSTSAASNSHLEPARSGSVAMHCRPLRHLTARQFEEATRVSDSASDAHIRGSQMLARAVLKCTVGEAEKVYVMSRNGEAAASDPFQPTASSPRRKSLASTIRFAETRASMLSILAQPRTQQRLRAAFRQLDSPERTGRVYLADFVTAARAVRLYSSQLPAIYACRSPSFHHHLLLCLVCRLLVCRSRHCELDRQGRRF